MTMVSNYATAAEQSGLYLIAIWRAYEDWLLVMKTMMMTISPDMYTEFWLQFTSSESFIIQIYRLCKSICVRLIFHEITSYRGELRTGEKPMKMMPRFLPLSLLLLCHCVCWLLFEALQFMKHISLSLNTSEVFTTATPVEITTASAEWHKLTFCETTDLNVCVFSQAKYF